MSTRNSSDESEHDSDDLDGTEEKMQAEFVGKKGVKGRLYPSLVNDDEENQDKGKKGVKGRLYPSLVNDEEENQDKGTGSSEGSQVISVWWLLLVLVILVSVLVAVFVEPSSLFKLLQRDNGEASNHHSSFRSAINQMSTRYSHQDAKLWKDITITGDTYYRESEIGKKLRQPLVLTFVGYDDDADTVHELAKDVANAFSPNNFLELQYSKDLGNTDLKSHFDFLLDSHLQKNERGAVFIKGLNLLTYDTASIFFKYCDQSDTKYPRAVFIFSLTVPRDNYPEVATSTIKTVVSASERFLVQEKWGYVSEELASALSVRVVDTALYVNGER